MDDIEFKREQRRQLMAMLQTYGVEFSPKQIDDILDVINRIDRELKGK